MARLVRPDRRLVLPVVVLEFFAMAALNLPPNSIQKVPCLVITRVNFGRCLKDSFGRVQPSLLIVLPATANQLLCPVSLSRSHARWGGLLNRGLSRPTVPGPMLPARATTADEQQRCDAQKNAKLLFHLRAAY